MIVTSPDSLAHIRITASAGETDQENLQIKTRCQNSDQTSANFWNWLQTQWKLKILSLINCFGFEDTNILCFSFLKKDNFSLNFENWDSISPKHKIFMHKF